MNQSLNVTMPRDVSKFSWRDLIFFRLPLPILLVDWGYGNTNRTAGTRLRCPRTLVSPTGRRNMSWSLQSVLSWPKKSRFVYYTVSQISSHHQCWTSRSKRGTVVMGSVFLSKNWFQFATRELVSQNRLRRKNEEKAAGCGAFDHSFLQSSSVSIPTLSRLPICRSLFPEDVQQWGFSAAWRFYGLGVHVSRHASDLLCRKISHWYEHDWRIHRLVGPRRGQWRWPTAILQAKPSNPEPPGWRDMRWHAHLALWNILERNFRNCLESKLVPGCPQSRGQPRGLIITICELFFGMLGFQESSALLFYIFANLSSVPCHLLME